MQIIRQEQEVDSDKWRDWHILTVAESGFSTLTLYGHEMHGVDGELISAFADRVNSHDEAGCLLPNAPVSALPNRFFRDISEDDIPYHITDFKRHLNEFLSANRTTIRANRILVDFHVSPAPVPEPYVTATEEVFRENAEYRDLDTVVIFT